MALLVGNQEIVPPKIEGCQDVFSSASVVISKPRWVSDDHVSECQSCSVRFGHLRRRHHCRHCGLVYCGKCCDRKMLLPQLGYTQPERVCGSCCDMATLTQQAFSTEFDAKLLAVEALSNMCKETDQIKAVAELGGVYALIHAARIHNDAIRSLVLSGLHSLAMHANLHQFLSDSGAITATCRILSEAEEKCTQLLLDGVHVLILFCKSLNIKEEVLKAGALEPLLHLCSSINTTLALLALHCLSVIAESLDTHDMIVDNSERNTLTRIMALINSREEQVQELALKTLARLSSGRDWHRQRIIQESYVRQIVPSQCLAQSMAMPLVVVTAGASTSQPWESDEDIFNGNCLVKVLGSRPHNLQILCNAACLVANLASTPLMQGSFHDQQAVLCRLVEDFPIKEDMLVYCARGLANSCQFPENAVNLLPHLPFLASVLFTSPNPSVRQHALRMCILLLRHCPETVNTLGGTGAMAMLYGLANIPDVLVAIETEVEKVVPKICQVTATIVDNNIGK